MKTAGNEVNDFDMIRNTEIHLTGETTLDNGLTVGAHFETAADGGDDFGVDESYIYMSGGWGRVNVGDEDGAGYLLQVAAPSADENIDGIRQFVNPVNYTILGTGCYCCKFSWNRWWYCCDLTKVVSIMIWIQQVKQQS